MWRLLLVLIDAKSFLTMSSLFLKKANFSFSAWNHRRMRWLHRTAAASALPTLQPVATTTTTTTTAAAATTTTTTATTFETFGQRDRRVGQSWSARDGAVPPTTRQPAPELSAQMMTLKIKVFNYPWWWWKKPIPIFRFVNLTSECSQLIWLTINNCLLRWNLFKYLAKFLTQSGYDSAKLWKTAFTSPPFCYGQNTPNSPCMNSKIGPMRSLKLPTILPKSHAKVTKLTFHLPSYWVF